MKDNKKIKIRSIKDGDWYWIDKTILNLYGSKLRPSAIAVYNVLAYFSNSKTQLCFPSQKAVAELVGLSRRTVTRKLKVLKKLGLIKIEKKRGRCIYHLLKAPVTKKAQVCDKKDIQDVTKENTNKNYINRINNKNVDKKFINPNFKSVKRRKPKTREELLALDIAKGLNDYDSLSIYLSYAKKYPESLLRKLLGEIKEVPEEKIRKGRAAFFNYLIKIYAKKTFKNYRD